MAIFDYRLYIYIYIERERDLYLYIYIYICVYVSTCLRAPEKRVWGLWIRDSKIYVPEAGGPLKSNENQGFCGSAVYVPASGIRCARDSGFWGSRGSGIL